MIIVYLRFETSLSTSIDNHNAPSQNESHHFTLRRKIKRIMWVYLKCFYYPEMSGNYFLLSTFLWWKIYWKCEYIFAFNTASKLPRIYSYNFWILFVRTSASYFRDVGGGNRLFCPKLSGLIVFRSGDLSSQGRCWSSSLCSNCLGLLIVYDLHAHAHIMRFATGKHCHLYITLLAGVLYLWFMTS